MLDLLLSEIAADVEGEAVAAGVDGALGEQAGEPSVVIGEGTTEKLPRTVGVAASSVTQTPAAGRPKRVWMWEVMGDMLPSILGLGAFHSQAFRVCGQLTVKSFRLTAKDAKDAKERE